MPLQRQLVIFSADSARASLTDLAGLLVGVAHVTTMGGTARVSVQVDAAWRVHALAAEFAARGLSIGWAQDADGEYWVRTSYAKVLVGMQPPSFLDGSRLRLWFMASGRLEDGSIVLRLGNNHAMARRALAPLGLDGAIETGPVIRITGAEKVTRFGDLIGERPSAAPESAWPPPRRVAAADDRAAVAGGKRTAGRGARAGNGAGTAEDLLVLGELLGAAGDGGREFGGEADDVHAGVAGEEPGAEGGEEGRYTPGSGAGDEGEAGGGADKGGADKGGADKGGADKRGADKRGADKRGADKRGRAAKVAAGPEEPAAEKVAKKRVARKKAGADAGEQPAPDNIAQADEGESAGKEVSRKRAPRKSARSKETAQAEAAQGEAAQA